MVSCPASALNPVEIIGLFAVAGMVTQLEALGKLFVFQFEVTFQSELVAPVQLILLLIPKVNTAPSGSVTPL